MLSAQASEIGRRPLVFRSLDFKGKEEKTRHIQRHTVRPSAYKSIARVGRSSGRTCLAFTQFGRERKWKHYIMEKGKEETFGQRAISMFDCP